MDSQKYDFWINSPSDYKNCFNLKLVIKVKHR